MLGSASTPVSQALALSDLSTLVADAAEVVASLELVLPVCESGALRHLITHLGQRAETAGPPWVHAMWPFERTWGDAIQWLKQKHNPAVSIMRQWLAFLLSSTR